MSTRAMVDFVDSWDLAESMKREPDLVIPKDDDTFYAEGKKLYRVSARIYRHCDGYPEGLGADLMHFLRAVEAQTDDTRFADSEYLAARFVVWQALEYTVKETNYLTGKPEPKNPLDFIGLGVGRGYHEDLEFVYRVDCNNLDARGWPEIMVSEFGRGGGGILKFKPLPKAAVKAFEKALKAEAKP